MKTEALLIIAASTLLIAGCGEEQQPSCMAGAELSVSSTDEEITETSFECPGDELFILCRRSPFTHQASQPCGELDYAVDMRIAADGGEVIKLWLQRSDDGTPIAGRAWYYDDQSGHYHTATAGSVAVSVMDEDCFAAALDLSFGGERRVIGTLRTEACYLRGAAKR